MALAPNCLPRTVTVSSACGCTLTAASIKGLTPAEFENLSNKEIDLARIIMNATEAKILGVQEKGLPALLRSAIKDIKPKLGTTKVDEQSIILPYIQRTQRSYINANYFTIASGAATSGAGSGGIPASAWDVIVNMGSSWLKTDLANIERYFLPGNTLIVLTWDNTTNRNAKTLVFTIVKAVNADSGGVAQAKVTLQPNITDTAFIAMSSGAKAAYQPSFGVAQTGANSINNRESWCYNQPSNLSRKILVNWIQTTRTSRCVDDAYLDTLKQIMDGKINPFMSGFQWTSLAEQNKQQAMLEDDAFMRTCFYGQRLNELQQVETYDQLPPVSDPNDPSCTLEYKANALGFFTILSDCNRVVDLNGAQLDLDYLFQQIYYLKRYREADGDTIAVIDCMTDRFTSANIFDAMSKYYKNRFGVDTTRFANLNQKIQFDGIIMFNYNIYDLPDQGVQWAVFHDQFFDDMLSAFPTTVGGQNFKSRAKQLWFLDFSDMTIGIASTMSVRRKQPDEATNALYQCVMVANHKEFTLRSQKFTPMLDRPQRHLIVHNFAEGCPHVTAQGCVTS